MAQIAEATEPHLYKQGSIPNRAAEPNGISAVVGLAAVTAAEHVGASCIVTPTMTGRHRTSGIELSSSCTNLCSNTYRRKPTLFTTCLGRYFLFLAKWWAMLLLFLNKPVQL